MARRRGRYTDDELRAMVGEQWERAMERDRRRRQRSQSAPEPERKLLRSPAAKRVARAKPTPVPPAEAPPAGGPSAILARVSSVSAHYMPASTGRTIGR